MFVYIIRYIQNCKYIYIRVYVYIYISQCICTYPPPLAKVQGGRGGLKYNTGFVLFCLWISPSMHIHIYMYIYIYICTFFLK